MAKSESGTYISIVIPTLDEEDNIGRLISGIKEVLKKKNYEIIVVDGNSRDATAAVARRNGAKVLADSAGKGSALIKGLNAASGSIIVSMDADLSHDPKELGLLIKKVEERYDICMGSRFMKGGRTEDMSLFRLVGNRLFVCLVNFRFGSHYTDMCYGLRSFRKGVVRKLELREEGFGIETEININAIRKGFRIIEVPSTEWKRNSGESKLRTFIDGYVILRTIIRNSF